MKHPKKHQLKQISGILQKPIGQPSKPKYQSTEAETTWEGCVANRNYEPQEQQEVPHQMEQYLEGVWDLQTGLQAFEQLFINFKLAESMIAKFQQKKESQDQQIETLTASIETSKARVEELEKMMAKLSVKK